VEEGLFPWPQWHNTKANSVKENRLVTGLFDFILIDQPNGKSAL
jgi:hypothetical protein